MKRARLFLQVQPLVQPCVPAMAPLSWTLLLLLFLCPCALTSSCLPEQAHHEGCSHISISGVKSVYKQRFNPRLTVVSQGLTETGHVQVDKSRAQSTHVRAEGEEPDKELAPVLDNSIAWGGFVSTSTNLRYQLVNGFEERALVSTCFAVSATHTTT